MSKFAAYQPWQIYSLIFFIHGIFLRYFSYSIPAVSIISITFGGALEIASKYIFVLCNNNSAKQTVMVKTCEETDTDEELEEKYANIAVNFDESETEEEEYIPKSIVAETYNDISEEYHAENTMKGTFDGSPMQISTDDFFEEKFQKNSDETPQIGYSRGKSFIEEEFIPENPGKNLMSTKFSFIL